MNARTSESLPTRSELALVHFGRHDFIDISMDGLSTALDPCGAQQATALRSPRIARTHPGSPPHARRPGLAPHSARRSAGGHLFSLPFPERARVGHDGEQRLCPNLKSGLVQDVWGARGTGGEARRGGLGAGLLQACWEPGNSLRVRARLWARNWHGCGSQAGRDIALRTPSTTLGVVK